LQGTVRWTHYTVIYDENKLPVDTLQQGTHTASYSYARATKAVRWVANLLIFGHVILG
jgi:eukaryotic translation initiation factor 2C